MNNMNVFYPPHIPNKLSPFPKGYPKIFLGGSIEMGKADEWQARFIEYLKDEKVILFNPRRKDWDSSWEQSLTNKNFREQVEWELSCFEMSDIIVIYLDPNTTSPISLLEFGLFIKDTSKELFVYCPKEFYRSGNIDVTALKYKRGDCIYTDEALMLYGISLRLRTKFNI